MKNKILMTVLAVAMTASMASAEVGITGEGVFGFVSDGTNAPLTQASGFSSTTGLPGNYIWIGGEIAPGVELYSELGIVPNAGAHTLNELNITTGGLKFVSQFLSDTIFLAVLMPAGINFNAQIKLWVVVQRSIQELLVMSPV